MSRSLWSSAVSAGRTLCVIFGLNKLFKTDFSLILHIAPVWVKSNSGATRKPIFSTVEGSVRVRGLHYLKSLGGYEQASLKPWNYGNLRVYPGFNIDSSILKTMELW